MPSTIEISVKGQYVGVPAEEILGTTVVSSGSWLKLAEIYDEPWQERSLADPAAVVRQLKTTALRADLFTFSQKIPDTQPRFPYAFIWDNVAAVPTSNFDAWWEGLPQETRKNVRRATKRGVEVRAVALDDELARGIKSIYDETPIRQGRRFWHYGKNVEAVARENSSYLDRSQFVGAFLGTELIGFLKMVYVGQTGRIMQILARNQHADKRPMNALLAKAIEICAQRGMSHFIYGQYVYGNNSDASMVEFKRRNGFEQVLLPKYYVPLTWKGAAAMKLRLHLGIRHMLPRKVQSTLLNLRGQMLQRTVARDRDGQPAPQSG